MTTTAIRKKLANYMKVADEKKIKAVYALLEEEIRQNERLTIEEYNRELDEAEGEFKNGDYVTHSAMKKKIKQW